MSDLDSLAGETPCGFGHYAYTTSRWCDIHLTFRPPSHFRRLPLGTQHIPSPPSLDRQSPVLIIQPGPPLHGFHSPLLRPPLFPCPPQRLFHPRPPPQSTPTLRQIRSQRSPLHNIYLCHLLHIPRLHSPLLLHPHVRKRETGEFG